MTTMLGLLALAATLEVGGDAAIRYGLTRSAWPLLLIGALALVAYGLLVNWDRDVEFNRLMGIYIAVFFVVSQTIAWFVFGDRPSTTVVMGGLLIVAGGLVIQAGAP
jgi:drug/metabolite transporter superfamily protein YnfA